MTANRVDLVPFIVLISLISILVSLKCVNCQQYQSPPYGYGYGYGYGNEYQQQQQQQRRLPVATLRQAIRSSHQYQQQSMGATPSLTSSQLAAVGMGITQQQIDAISQQATSMSMPSSPTPGMNNDTISYHIIHSLPSFLLVYWCDNR
jgi:hypothetical protein